MIDIVFPKNNESEFLEMAERLGHDGLVFVYEKRKDISEFQKRTKLKLFSTTAKKIMRSKGDARPLLEKSKNIIAYGLEDQEKDFTKIRNSGLNDVLCQIAKKNNITMGISLSSVLLAKRKSIVMGRMMQNAMLCKKIKVNMVLASFADNPWQMRAESDLKAVAREIGVLGNMFLNDLKTEEFLNGNN